MLQIILIGAALSHVRPEPQADDDLPADPLHEVREHWRSSSGLSAIWR